MSFSFATCAALLLLLTAASCAPVGPGLQGDACADVRSSSLELNHVAKTISLEMRNGTEDVIDFSHYLPWVEPEDKCDPETLRHKSMPCIGKILRILSIYNSTMERVAGFKSCSQFANRVKPALQRLHKDMGACVKSRGGMDHELESHISTEEPQPVALWQESPLCNYTMDRLFSFSIITARVCAAVDGPWQAEGSARQCI